MQTLHTQTSEQMMESIKKNLSGYTKIQLDYLITYFEQRQDTEKVEVLKLELLRRDL